MIRTIGRSAAGGPAVLCATLLGTLSLACGRPTTPGSRSATGGAVSPLPRSVQVEQDSVVVEGRWFPVEVGPGSPVARNAVRVVCRRAERSCKEDLTHLVGEAGAGPVQQLIEYRVDDWTRWGQPVGRLIASRREGGARIEIRVSLSGLAAEKVVIEKGRETRWRIE